MDNIDLDLEISNNLSIELDIDENDGSWGTDGNWKKQIKIKVTLMYNGKEISSDYQTIDVG